MKPGTDADGVAGTDTDNFMKCPACGQWFDMRDLMRRTIKHRPSRWKR